MTLEQVEVDAVVRALRAGCDVDVIGRRAQLLRTVLDGAEGLTDPGARHRTGGRRARVLDSAIRSVVVEAHAHGITSDTVNALVIALGPRTHDGRVHVIDVCAELDAGMRPFRTRPLVHVVFPYLLCDAIRFAADGPGAIRAAVVATGVTPHGGREVLGVEVGDSEDGRTWASLLDALHARGLHGVELVISEHHLGLKRAVGTVVHEPWHRCTVRAPATGSVARSVTRRGADPRGR